MWLRKWEYPLLKSGLFQQLCNIPLVSNDCYILCRIMVATAKEIVIHSLYYDFFTNQSFPQSSIHFRLMVKLTGNHPKLCSTDLSMQVKHSGPTWNIFSVCVSLYIRHLSNLYPQHDGLRDYIQPCPLYPACPENPGALPVCIQKIGLTYMIGIAESWNGKCRERNRHHKTLVFVGGHHEGIRIHHIFRRICIIGTVVKSPVKGHGGHISDCAQLEPYLVLADCTVQILLYRYLDLILVHCQKVIHLAGYKYFLIYYLFFVVHKYFWFNKLL